ncbi:MAG TPA: hypothetical protein VK081_02710 [Planctomycetota bacterium]|nr:hypothetical protein [Planctomycetota bacterium]
MSLAPLLCAAVAAQTQLVLPAAATTAEAPLRSLLPFSTSTGFRWQQIWFDARLGALQTTIHEIAYRADDGPGSQIFPFPATTFTNVVAKLGWTMVSPFAMSTEFASNTTGGALTVAFQGGLSLPTHTPTGVGPAPFRILFPFQQPVTIGMSGHPVVFEVTASGGPAGAYPVDAEDSLFAPGWSRPFGTGSVPFSGPQLVVPGELLTYRACWSQPLSWLGVLGAQQVAVDLAPFGAPGEWLHASPDALIFGTSVSRPLPSCPWSFDLVFRVPSSPALEGGKVFAQTLLLDPAANALGVRASNGVETSIGRVPAYASGTLFVASPTATQGVLGTVAAPVARITGVFQ